MGFIMTFVYGWDVCAFVCVSLCLYVCVCACIYMCVQGHMHVCMEIDIGAFLNPFQPNFLRRNLMNSATLAGQKALGVLLFQHLLTWACRYVIWVLRTEHNKHFTQPSLWCLYTCPSFCFVLTHPHTALFHCSSPNAVGPFPQLKWSLLLPCQL